jgi:hypothetical protein
MIDLLVAVLVVGLVCYGVWWICVHFQLPKVFFWVAGTVLLLILLDYAGHQLGLVSGPLLPK